MIGPQSPDGPQSGMLGEQAEYAEAIRQVLTDIGINLDAIREDLWDETGKVPSTAYADLENIRTSIRRSLAAKLAQVKPAAEEMQQEATTGLVGAFSEILSAGQALGIEPAEPGGTVRMPDPTGLPPDFPSDPPQLVDPQRSGVSESNPWYSGNPPWAIFGDPGWNGVDPAATDLPQVPVIVGINPGTTNRNSSGYWTFGYWSSSTIPNPNVSGTPTVCGYVWTRFVGSQSEIPRFTVNGKNYQFRPHSAPHTDYAVETGECYSGPATVIEQPTPVCPTVTVTITRTQTVSISVTPNNDAPCLPRYLCEPIPKSLWTPLHYAADPQAKDDLSILGDFWGELKPAFMAGTLSDLIDISMVNAPPPIQESGGQ